MEGTDAKVAAPTSSSIAPVVAAGQETMAEFMAMMQAQFAEMSATFLEKFESIEKKQETLGSTIEATNTALGDLQIQTSNLLTQLEQDMERQEAAVDRLPSLRARSSHAPSVSERRKSVTFSFMIEFQNLGVVWPEFAPAAAVLPPTFQRWAGDRAVADELKRSQRLAAKPMKRWDLAEVDNGTEQRGGRCRVFDPGRLDLKHVPGD